MAKNSGPRAPQHLEPGTRDWWRGAVKELELSDEEVNLLTLAGEAWDRNTQAREAIKEHGLTYEDANGNPRLRPEVAVERDSKTIFSRLIKQLGLKTAPRQATENESFIR